MARRAPVSHQPIRRYVPTDPYDANNKLKYNPLEEVTLYYAFLYRNKKPVYKLSCIYKNILNDAIDNFLSNEEDLKFMIDIQSRKVNINQIDNYKDVLVEVIENE